MLKRTLIVITILGFLFSAGRWLHLQLAYAEIERLTKLHGDELATAIGRIITDVKYPLEGYTQTLEDFKVFEFSETNAKVFVVIRLNINRPGLPDYDRSGEFYYLIFRDGDWKVDDQRPRQVVWSNLGSADGETWPPYR